MTKQEWKYNYRLVRMGLKNNPEYIPKTQGQYFAYEVIIRSRPCTISQLFIATYGRKVSVMAKGLLK